MTADSSTTEATNTITLDEAKLRWDALFAKINGGEEWVITDAGGQPVARLVPVTQGTPAPKEWAAIGMMKGQIEVAPDFDEPLEDMKPYME